MCTHTAQSRTKRCVTKGKSDYVASSEKNDSSILEAKDISTVFLGSLQVQVLPGMRGE